VGAQPGPHEHFRTWIAVCVRLDNYASFLTKNCSRRMAYYPKLRSPAARYLSNERAT
jgi:hypothetical protein